jgi:hypothetical protein
MRPFYWGAAVGPPCQSGKKRHALVHINGSKAEENAKLQNTNPKHVHHYLKVGRIIDELGHDRKVGLLAINLHSIPRAKPSVVRLAVVLDVIVSFVQTRRRCQCETSLWASWANTDIGNHQNFSDKTGNWKRAMHCSD